MTKTSSNPNIQAAIAVLQDNPESSLKDVRKVVEADGGKLGPRQFGEALRIIGAPSRSGRPKTKAALRRTRIAVKDTKTRVTPAAKKTSANGRLSITVADPADLAEQIRTMQEANAKMLDTIEKIAATCNDFLDY